MFFGWAFWRVSFHHLFSKYTKYRLSTLYHYLLFIIFLIFSFSIFHFPFSCSARTDVVFRFSATFFFYQISIYLLSTSIFFHFSFSFSPPKFKIQIRYSSVVLFQFCSFVSVRSSCSWFLDSLFSFPLERLGSL